MDEELRLFATRMGISPELLETMLNEQAAAEERILAMAAEYEERTGRPFIEFQEN